MKCGIRVGKGSITYPCTVELPVNGTVHAGPCMAVENPSSVGERKRWLGLQQAAQANLSQFQQVADRPFADSTPVPGSDLQPAQYREVHKPLVGEIGEAPVPTTPTVCPHPYDQVTPVEGGMACAQCGNVLEAPRKADSLRDFVEEHPAPQEEGAPVAPAVTAMPSPAPLPVDELGAEPWVSPGVPVSQPVETHEIPVPEEWTIEPTKQREGDQRLPAEGNPRPAVQDTIIELMQESKKVGTERYGQPLKPMNGRDTLLDAAEEARDLLVYLTCLQAERHEISEKVSQVYGIMIHLATTEPRLISPEHVDRLMKPIVAWFEGTPET